MAVMVPSSGSSKVLKASTGESTSCGTRAASSGRRLKFAGNQRRGSTLLQPEFRVAVQVAAQGNEPFKSLPRAHPIDIRLALPPAAAVLTETVHSTSSRLGSYPSAVAA